jgi:hypothetical protein
MEALHRVRDTKPFTSPKLGMTLAPLAARTDGRAGREGRAGTLDHGHVAAS